MHTCPGDISFFQMRFNDDSQVRFACSETSFYVNY